MVRKMRVALALQPIATALFANSPFAEGRPSGFLSERAEIWRFTDPARCGALPWVFEPGFGFEAYVDWALDVPMYFVARDGVYHDATDVTFRQYLGGALKDRLPGVTPNVGDWDNHLSTLFPDVRLKRFLEMRGADSGPDRIWAVSALWVGLLYDADSLGAAADLVADWTAAERAALVTEVPRLALKTPFRGGTVADIARQMVALGRDGLARRDRRDETGSTEARYLAAVEGVLERGETPAEILLRRYHTAWGSDIDRVFAESAF
jgi:glutamate--cysteine ligase